VTRLKRRRRSGLNWTSASASVERKRSARGGGRPIRMASQLAGKGSRATPYASESDCTGISDVFLRCMSMSREGSVREQEDPKIRREDGIANQSGPIGFSHESTTSSSTFPSSIAEQDHNTSRKLVNPLIELFSSPILFATGNHFPSVLLHNQGLPRFSESS
jgi:hypothetical protein